MKLVNVHVTNFRCILDSNPVAIGTTTCLVGKNEAGKTAFLKALECVRSVNSGYQEYSRTEDYPRRLLAEYDERQNGDEAEVVRTIWSMDQQDCDTLEEEFGKGVLDDDEVVIRKS